MPEHTLLRLAEGAGRAADIPEFRDLVRRARRRRRRRYASIAIAAVGSAALVATAMILPGGDGDRSAPPVSPPKPSPSASGPRSTHYLLHHPAALVNQPDAAVLSTSYAGRNNAAALWQVCGLPIPNASCPEVVTWTSDGWRTSHAYKIPDKLAIYDLPGGSVLVWLFDGGFVLDRHGHRLDLSRSTQPVLAAPGGRYVNLPAGPQGEAPAGVLDTRTGTVHPPLAGTATNCVFDDRWSGGTLWEYGATRCGHGRPHVAWTSDLGRTWSTKTERRPILGIVVTPQRTAILLGSRYNELAALDVSTDGGASWHLSELDRPIVAPDDWASTPDGHLFVASGSRLYEADTSWQAFRLVGGRTAAGVVAADGVVATYGSQADRIAVSYDDGSTWRAVSPRPSP